MLGQLIGRRYQIISHLGKGGFSQIYLARDTQLPGNPECVVKKLTLKATDSSNLTIARRLFNLEAKILQQLGQHNQIPQLFAYFEENQEFYLVQEFIRGHLLNQELIPGEKLNNFDTIDLLLSILKPLAFVHYYNVIHRDIKPSNLIRRQQDGEIVLIDFGAVKQLTSSLLLNDQITTARTCIIGTPYYMPMEQSIGYPRLSSDIYAVGIIGIQALTGKHPIALTTDLQTEQLIWRNLASTNNQLANILDKMTCPDCRNRYQSVSEIVEELNYLKKFSNNLPKQIKVKSLSSTPKQIIYKLSKGSLNIDVATSSYCNLAGSFKNLLGSKSFFALYILCSVVIILITMTTLRIGFFKSYRYQEKSEFIQTPSLSGKTSNLSLANKIKIR